MNQQDEHITKPRTPRRILPPLILLGIAAALLAVGIVPRLHA
jgi:hypothetical protein